MPTQRMIMATVAGKSAEFAETQFARWRGYPNPAELDRFCRSIRDNALSLVIVYYSEWLDRWSSGYHVQEPETDPISSSSSAKFLAHWPKTLKSNKRPKPYQRGWRKSLPTVLACDIFAGACASLLVTVVVQLVLAYFKK